MNKKECNKIKQEIINELVEVMHKVKIDCSYTANDTLLRVLKLNKELM